MWKLAITLFLILYVDSTAYSALPYQSKVPVVNGTVTVWVDDIIYYPRAKVKYPKIGGQYDLVYEDITGVPRATCVNPPTVNIPSPVPEPNTLLLLTTGIVLLYVRGRKWKRK